MPKMRVLNAARPGFAELTEVWGPVRLGFALSHAELSNEPLSDMDIARILELPLSRTHAKLHELIAAGRIEKLEGGGYAACSEWAQWTVDKLIDISKRITEAIDG